METTIFETIFTLNEKGLSVEVNTETVNVHPFKDGCLYENDFITCNTNQLCKLQIERKSIDTIKAKAYLLEYDVGIISELTRQFKNSALYELGQFEKRINKLKAHL